MSESLEPEQKEIKGTYMENRYIADSIRDYFIIEGATLRELMTGTWANILWTCFPQTKGFSVQFFPGATCVVDLRRLEETELITYFLAVELSFAENHEEHDTIIKNGPEDLERFLQGVEGQHRKFGAFGVGKYVRFYELVDGQLADFEGHGGHYLPDRQCQTINEKMLYFCDNHTS